MKKFSAPADRNKEPILQRLKEHLPEAGEVLEIASGSGQHVSFWAPSFANLTFWPTDLEEENLGSINIYRQGISNIQPAQKLDVLVETWPLYQVDAIINCNMIHISPWEVTIGLLKGAAKVLKEEGSLILYGPFFFKDREKIESNVRFDQWLKDKDESFGVRYFEEVCDLAKENGLSFEKIYEMPANNNLIVFRKSAS